MQAACNKRNPLTSLVLLWLLYCLSATVVQAQDNKDADDISIGTVGGQLGADGFGNADIFTHYLDSHIPGKHFRLVSFNTIEELISAVDNNQIKFAFATPIAYVQLSQRHNLRPMATVTQEVNGRMYPWLAASVFVRADRQDLMLLADAAGQRVTALSPLALGGWLAALREWRDLGVSEKDFKSLDFDFSYTSIMDAVCKGREDVGVLPTTFFTQIRETCPVPLRVLKLQTPIVNPRFPVEISTRTYPEVAFAEIGYEDESLVNRVMQALLFIEPGSDVARSINVGGFTAPLAYDSVAELMKELQVAPFTGYGQITVSQFLRQHRGSLALLLFLIAAGLALVWVRNNLLRRKVRQSELFRNQIFARSHFAVLMLNAHSQEIVDVNSTALFLLGYQKAEQLVGQTPLAFSAPIQQDGKSAHESITSIHDELQFDQNPLVVEWLMQRPDGEPWDAEWHIVPFSYGDGQFIQVTLVDITERRRIVKERERMEQQLQHSQRLESIGRFSGAIAHDFNNLLTVINGYSELLVLNATPADKQLGIYREINQACARAGELTNQLLTFSRRRMARMEALDINAIISASVSMFQRLLGETITLRTSLGNGMLVTLADSGQLHQVLMNFVANSRDAMPAGGEFLLATDQCAISELQARQLNLEAGNYIKLLISDTGVGMTHEVQSKIFEPFFTTKGERGTGFGLATAYGIIKQCRGSITFKSEPGAGTTFTIYLPMVEAMIEQSRIDIAAPQLSLKGQTVLVVEDERDVRSFACMLLQSFGINVLEADSGTNALELSKTWQGQIHLLFTDIVLGDISGVKLAEQFQALYPAMPVLFTSGYPNDELALGDLMQQRVAFIAKPYSPAMLFGKISVLLEPKTETA